MEEIWKDIKGYEGRYKISNLGNIRGLQGVIKLKESKGLHYFRMNHDGYKRMWYCVEDILHKTFPEQFDAPQYAQVEIPGEHWIDIHDYEGLYQISDHGRVRSVTHHILMKNGRYKTILSKILILHEGGNNEYLLAYLHQDNCVKNHLVHRLVAEHFIGHVPSDMDINHKDGNKHNNHVQNLEIVTRQQNIDHSIATGLFNSYGENQGRAKLTNKQADEIRHLYKTSALAQHKIAEMYNVSQSCISEVVNFKTYFK